MDYEIKLKFQDEILKGVLIKEDENIITIKLSSGYNANLNKNNVEIISKKKIEKKEVVKKEKLKSNSDLPRITILHTGGTIASKVDYSTGAVSSKFTAEELLGLFSELNNVAQIDAKMIGNLFSEDMRFSHYNLMLKEIKLAIENGTQGIIISHGTDTLHYTSCALAYSLKNLSVPVILVGAQRSSDRPSSDAYTNLNAAVDFIIDNLDNEKKYLRVGICMHESINDDSYLILDGINAKKMHSTRRDAFKQVNYLPVARVLNKKIEYLREDLLSIINVEDTRLVNFTQYNSDLKIGFFKAHPNLFPEEIDSLSIYDAVIFEGTGLGHLSINQVDENTKIHIKNLAALKKLINKTKLIMGTQTVFGQVNMNVYSTGRYLKEIGILGNYMNLTTENLFIRVAYCLSQKEISFDDCWNSNLECFEIRNLDINENE